MPPMTGRASGLARLALGAAVLGALLLPLSYVWLFARLLDGGEPGWLFAVTVVAEIGALAAGVTALGIGVVAGLRSAGDHSDRKRGRIAALLGGGVLLAVVGINVLFMLLPPR